MRSILYMQRSGVTIFVSFADVIAHRFSIGIRWKRVPGRSIYVHPCLFSLWSRTAVFLRHYKTCSLTFFFFVHRWNLNIQSARHLSSWLVGHRMLALLPWVLCSMVWYLRKEIAAFQIISMSYFNCVVLHMFLQICILL